MLYKHFLALYTGANSMPKILGIMPGQFDVLCVDEYQDTSVTQQWLAVKAGKRGCAVGDPRQAIYAFRGCDGKGFEGGNWAEWTTLTIDCRGDGTPDDCETAFAGLGKCFLNLDLDGVPGPDFDRWGWSLTPIQIGSTRFPIFIHADGCDPEVHSIP